jgi:hypothetical protein
MLEVEGAELIRLPVRNAQPSSNIGPPPNNPRYWVNSLGSVSTISGFPR